MSLVVHYMFNEIVNGKIPDVSGNGNDLTITGKCSLVNNKDTENAANYSKCIYSADGPVGKIEKNGTLISGTSGTVSFFVKNDDNDYSNLLYTTEYSIDRMPEIAFMSSFLIGNEKTPGGGIIHFGEQGGSYHYDAYCAFSGLTSNNLNHLAFTYDAAKSKFLIYVNGVDINSSMLRNDFNPCSTRSLTIGIGHTGDGGYGTFDNAKPGYWSDFRYYDNVLTAQEIKKIYDDYYTATQKPASFKITKASQMISNEFIERTPNTSTKISIYENSIKCAELIENLNQNVPKMTKTGNLMCKEFVEKA